MSTSASSSVTPSAAGRFSDLPVKLSCSATTQAPQRLRRSFVAADYHVFPKRQWGTLPPFAVGRTVYDTWLIWRARSLRVPVIDATPVVMCIHQNHDRTYASLGMTAPDGIDDLRKGIEFRQNLKLAGGWPHVFTPRNSNWILTRH